MTHAQQSLTDWRPKKDILKDRIILITGAANGIGRAVAIDLSAHGATVILLDRDVHGMEQLYDHIVAAGSPEPAIYPMDLQGATPEHYTALATTLASEYGRLDGLIHNAAQLGALVPFANYDHELWFQTLQTNLNAPYLLTMACLELLNNSQDASVIFTSDEVGRQGRAYWGAYAVSKAGLEIFSQVLADELEANTHIRFNTIDPGAVRTTLRRTAYPAELADTLNTAEEITRPFLYLASTASKEITGQQLTVRDML